MKKKNVKVGEIALIPAGDGKFIPGKVLYLSKRYKDVVLLALSKKPITESNMPEDFLIDPSLCVYTSQVAIKNGRWKSVGLESLREQEKGLAVRIVGGSVWEEDEEIRPAAEDDYSSLPKMQVLGAALVEKKALQLAI